MNAFLCTLDEVGRLKPVHGVPKASMSGPAIFIESVEVENPTLKSDGESHLDLCVRGRVTGSRYDHVTDGCGEPRKLRVYQNDSDEPIALVDLAVVRRNSEGFLRPFPYDGGFGFRVQGVDVTEGNNVFELRTCDEFSLMDSVAKIWVEIEIAPKEGSGMEADDWVYDHLDQCELVVTKGPEVLQNPPEGESHLYTLAIADPALAHDSALKVDIPGDKKSGLTEMPTAYDAASGWRYLCIPESNYPAMFSLEFGLKYDGRAGLSLKHGKLMRRRPEAAMLPPDQRFRYGFHLGMGFSCLDVVFGKDRWISQGVHYDQIAGGMVLPVVVRPGRGKAEKVSVTLPAQLGGQGLEAPALFEICELCLYSMQLFASNDPRAEELVIALLTDNWADIGLAGHEIMDCRNVLFLYGPEILYELCKALVGSDPLDHGLHLGQAVSGMFKHLKQWHQKNGVEGYFTKAEFLETLG